MAGKLAGRKPLPIADTLKGDNIVKTINILGDSQRDQWHSIVNLLRQLGGNLDMKGRSDICDEIDRYIDFCEDIFDKMRKGEE